MKDNLDKNINKASKIHKSNDVNSIQNAKSTLHNR